MVSSDQGPYLMLCVSLPSHTHAAFLHAHYLKMSTGNHAITVPHAHSSYYLCKLCHSDTHALYRAIPYYLRDLMNTYSSP